ncbi:response regulator transcription factor [Rummeliibacillus suwonensis]|jgi:two-component system response regulator NreC|uniref:response regulator transcription factor n=1 Tax=Rummeliibacillus suwonensis TaxID=1306154 RepID=UPI001AAF6357|nr:response regulator transcription factor [Rummeliibacillus suwonensis]MBO2535354.1 response regulator transcription factor [Rummeliibacillus suwonensis]
MKILIVDDHPVVRDGLAFLLEDLFEIEETHFAEDGREAIVKALNHSFDLILLDLSMPEGMDGMQAIGELRRILPHAKIVIFSMYDEEVYQRKAYEAGADGYLIKQLKRDELVEQLKKIIHGEKLFANQQIVEKDGKVINDKKTPWDLPLTQREKDVFILTVFGNSQKEIAEKLGISVRTVENHRRNISNKLGNSKRSYWIEFAKQYNLLDIY